MGTSFDFIPPEKPLSLPPVVVNLPPDLAAKGIYNIRDIVNSNDPKLEKFLPLIGQAEAQRARLETVPNQERLHHERVAKLGVAEVKSLISGDKFIKPTFDADGVMDSTSLARLSNQMLSLGTTVEQRRRAYLPRISETLLQQIAPNTYAANDIKDTIKKFFNPFYKPDPTKPEQKGRASLAAMDRGWQGSEDAWRLYLGMPQINDSFTISKYRPSNAKTNSHYYAFNRDLDKGDLGIWPTDPEAIKEIINDIDNLNQSGEGGHKVGISPQTSYTLGSYQVSKGKDSKGHYLAYYDIWDLHVPHADKIGKPFEIYDRIYYDPETFMPYRGRGRQQ